ncbi:MAG TPA: HAD-IB family hydrolase [Chitinophagaceae bacterium]|nr:HAD-IB family hydrolase [Chitinophagaceae bacterium]
MTLALFDFDGTITKTDSLLHFTRFAVGNKRYNLGITWLSPVLLLNKLGILPSQLTKNIFLCYFFKNMPVVNFELLCRQYASVIISTIIHNSAIEKIKWHKQLGHRVIVVSASPEAYVDKWCKLMGIECIATRLQKKDGLITGKIEGANCNGAEKASRLKRFLHIDDYIKIIGYGNSAGDKQMLALCTETFFKPFG